MMVGPVNQSHLGAGMVEMLAEGQSAKASTQDNDMGSCVLRHAILFIQSGRNAIQPAVMRPKGTFRYNGCTTDVQGINKGCTRDVQGMYKGCTRDVQGMYKGSTGSQYRSNTQAPRMQYPVRSLCSRHSNAGGRGLSAGLPWGPRIGGRAGVRPSG